MEHPKVTAQYLIGNLTKEPALLERTPSRTPRLGDIVHYVQQKPAMYGNLCGPVHLPAIVTAVWGPACVNLQVLTDGTNSDEQHTESVKWVTSATLDTSANPLMRTWHWAEPVEPAV